MKRIVANSMKSLFILLFALAGYNVYALDNVEITPISTSKKANIAFTNNEASTVFVNVYNETQTEVLFTEKLKEKTDYNKLYDFNLLENGVYKIVIESGHKIVEKDVLVSKDNVLVIGSSLKYKPYFKLDGDNLIVSYLNSDLDKVKLSISGQNGIIYTDKESEDLSITKSYNLRKFEDGNYALYLESGDTMYSYFFEIE